MTSDPAPPPTPIASRIVILLAVAGLGWLAWQTQVQIGPRGQALCGVFCFFGLGLAASRRLSAVNWRTVGWGVALQLLIALVVLRSEAVRDGLKDFGEVVNASSGFSGAGGRFVFGALADPAYLSEKFDGAHGFIFAFNVLPQIIFASAFFTVLYHYGVLQLLVRGLAVAMRYFMGTSGAETLSVAANVFLGQTEAPLIVRPYVAGMTKSELFTLMVSGMAHVSGTLLAVYISYGADPVAILTTCVMACPCSLYLAKIILPETETPATAGAGVRAADKSPHANGIDAAAAGTRDGLTLAMNVGAILISFTAFVALADALLNRCYPGLTLAGIFGRLFAPAAFLTGVDPSDCDKVGELLGIKLTLNEHVAYLKLKEMKAAAALTDARSLRLAAFALTGFANFASVGIQIGGIGAMAPERRSDLARLGMTALFAGFLATLLNAAVAGVLM